MKEKFIQAHMKVAEIYSQLSYAKRLKVGAIIVKEDRIISIGYNGTPSGWNNSCEEIVWMDYYSAKTYNSKELEEMFPHIGYNDKGEEFRYKLKTKPEVLHAEANAISKLARSNESGQGASMFTTHAPCLECAKIIYGAGIKKVYFKKHYRDMSGLDFLNKCNIGVEQIE